MTAFVTVEPARDQRPGFAMWCLKQTPKIMTSSATGFDVPLDLYPSIPVGLLEGAYVDGFLYNRPDPKMRAEASERSSESPSPPVAEDVPEPDSETPQTPLKAEAVAKKTTRKRASRAKKQAPGAYTRKPSEVTTTVLSETSWGTE